MFLTQYIEFKKNNNNASVASGASYNLDMHIIIFNQPNLTFSNTKNAKLSTILLYTSHYI